MEGIGEMLTKEQMRKINGGYIGCWWSGNSDCNQGMSFVPCPSFDTDPCSCQHSMDYLCVYDDCCDNIDCGCQ